MSLRRSAWLVRFAPALIFAAALCIATGCGEEPRHGVPYRSENYSSRNGPYRTSGGSQEEWGLFSHGHSEHSDYDDGHGNGMTYSSHSSSSHFP
ncbi:MAG TPA: hypothetical protein VL860_06735 [Planctomycetota bacterium]|nr:hypothetical protein [Planctomycetota bacterium]